MRQTVDRFGRVDVLVSNAAYQMSHDTLEEITEQEWDHTFATNVSAMFHLVQASLPHLGEGSSIIGSSSVNSDTPSPQLVPYAATKGAIANLCASLAQLLGERGIRVNSVAPGPDLDAAHPVDDAGRQGRAVRVGHPARPRRGSRPSCAGAYVLLASDEGSYISGARIEVTGGRPVL